MDATDVPRRQCPALGAGALASLSERAATVVVRGEGARAEDLTRLLESVPGLRVGRRDAADGGPPADLVVDLDREHADGTAGTAPPTVAAEHGRYLAEVLHAVREWGRKAGWRRCSRCSAEYCFGALGKVLVQQFRSFARHGGTLLPQLPAVDPDTGVYHPLATACELDRRLEALRQRGESFTVLAVAGGEGADDAPRLGRRLSQWARGLSMVGHLGGTAFAVVMPGGSESGALLLAQSLVQGSRGPAERPAAAVASLAASPSGLDGFDLANRCAEAARALAPGEVELLAL